jgi:hypothetical protein
MITKKGRTQFVRQHERPAITPSLRRGAQDRAFSLAAAKRFSADMSLRT